MCWYERQLKYYYYCVILVTIVQPNPHDELIPAALNKCFDLTCFQTKSDA